MSEEGHLSFEGKQYKFTTAEEAKEIITAIEQYKDLKRITLSGNTFGVEASEAIAQALRSKTTLESVQFSDIFTSRLKTDVKKSVLAFAQAFSGLKNLREVDFSDNAFGPGGADSIAELIKNNHDISYLRLNNNGLGSLGGKTISEALIQAKEECTAKGKVFGLKVLIMGRNRLENEGAKSLSDAFKKIKTLNSICMPQNGISSAGIKCIAKAIKKNKSLKEIDLNDNTFKKEGAVAMAKSLSELQQLESINFGDCLMGINGGIEIANCLRSGHESLKSLDLSYNEFNSSVVDALVECLKNKKNLIKFNVSGNELAHGFQKLRAALAEYGVGDAYYKDEDFDEDEEVDGEPEAEDEDENDVEEQVDEEDDDEDDELEEKFASQARIDSTPSTPKKAVSVTPTPTSTPQKQNNDNDVEELANKVQQVLNV